MKAALIACLFLGKWGRERVRRRGTFYQIQWNDANGRRKNHPTAYPLFHIITPYCTRVVTIFLLLLVFQMGPTNAAFYHKLLTIRTTKARHSLLLLTASKFNKFKHRGDHNSQSWPLKFIHKIHKIGTSYHNPTDLFDFHTFLFPYHRPIVKSHFRYYRTSFLTVPAPASSCKAPASSPQHNILRRINQFSRRRFQAPLSQRWCHPPPLLISVFPF